MGPVDYTSHPDLPVTLSPELAQNLQVHLPKLQAPTLEDLLEDRIEYTKTSRTNTGSIGPVDVIDASDQARRFFEN